MANTSDVGLLTRKLGASDYDPERYVSEISQTCVGGEEIVNQRKTIQTLSDETSNQLKKNVYQNYSQFIETAKEISFLETDMYRLSHMITEQRKLLSSLVETSLLGDRVPLTHDIKEQDKVEEVEEPAPVVDGRQELVEVMEMVERGADVLNVANRILLHHGDLVEMDPDNNIALHRVHCYLTNDLLLIATWLADRRGPVRYELSSQYLLSQAPVVNVRDLAGVPNAIKLLVSPHPRLFQCKNAESKREWLMLYEEAKKNQKDGGRITKPSKKQAPEVPEADNPKNPFYNDEELEESIAVAYSKQQSTIELPELLVELSDTLDVHIAQREFEQAVELLKEAQTLLASMPDVPQVREIADVATKKEQDLVEVLRGELKVSPDRSLHSGPRTARRAVHLLSNLGRSIEAPDLLLAHRRALNQNTVKNCRTEGTTRLYIQRLASAFFHQITDSIKEFDTCFPNQGKNMSLFVMWLEEETEWFTDILEKHIFSSQSPLSTVADCVAFLREQAKKLITPGLDILFMIDARFQSSIEKIIMEQRDKAVEAVKLRHVGDNWETYKFTNRAGMESVIGDMVRSGVVTIHSHVIDQFTINLTSNTVSFSLSYLTFTDHLLQLYTSRVRHLVNESLVNVLHAHLRHLDQAVRSDKVANVQPSFLVRNAAFLLDTVLTLVEHKYEEKTKSDCPKLAKLHSNYSWLKEMPKITKSKYEDADYV